MEKVDRKSLEPRDCWLWTGAVNNRGYGQAWDEGRLQLAHRVVYELENGPIPVGLQLDHLCRVRACVNPAHLEPVTPSENSQRGNACKLTDDEVGQILASADDALTLAARFGVSRNYVYQLRRGTVPRGVVA